VTDRRTDGRTDGIAMAYTRYSIYAVARKNVRQGDVSARKLAVRLKIANFTSDVFRAFIEVTPFKYQQIFGKRKVQSLGYSVAFFA